MRQKIVGGLEPKLTSLCECRLQKSKYCKNKIGSINNRTLCKRPLIINSFIYLALLTPRNVLKNVVKNASHSDRNVLQQKK